MDCKDKYTKKWKELQLSYNNSCFFNLPKTKMLILSHIHHVHQGFFASEVWSVIRTQSQCQIVSFFPIRGRKIPNLLQTAKVISNQYKNGMYRHKFQKIRSDGFGWIPPNFKEINEDLRSVKVCNSTIMQWLGRDFSRWANFSFFQWFRNFQWAISYHSTQTLMGHFLG